MPPTIITLGASAGGIEALSNVVRGLHRGIDASLFVAMHIGAESVLADILDRRGDLPAALAEDGRPFEPGRIYVAPPGHHLLVGADRMTLLRGPRENGHRPAIDLLFRSAAREHRDRVIGVLLSGLLDDGVAGLFAIQARRGVVVVQDPSDASSPDMPRNALRYVGADHCVPAAEIGALLMDLAARRHMRKSKTKKPQERRRAAKPAKPANPAKPAKGMDASPAPRDPKALAHAAAPFVCPECHGPLFEVHEHDLRQWRCIVGHGFSPESLSEAHSEALERALWIAGRTLQERVYLRRVLAGRGGEESNPALVERLNESADAAERDLRLIREILNRI